jgi:hypothetical protein
MSTLNFLRLPVNPDEGFPQSFRLAFGNRSYVFGLAVNIAEEVLPDPTTPDGLAAAITLPAPGAYLVLTVVRDDVTGGTVLLRRKVIPDLIYHAGELALVVRSVRIAIGNLHGSGAYRSDVVAGVALR